MVLRERMPFAGTGSGLSYADCPECHGAGVVLDDYGEWVRMDVGVAVVFVPKPCYS